MKISSLFILLGCCIIACCERNKQERFFTQLEYEQELNQSVNTDVLERIRKDSAITKDKMIFSFYFITNERSKIDSLMDYLEKHEDEQQLIELNKINKIWELNGRSYPIDLEIYSINKWEKKMWEIGYKFDCKLDGWETTYLD